MGCTVSSHISGGDVVGSENGNIRRGNNDNLESNPNTGYSDGERVWKNQPLKIPTRCVVSEIDSMTQLQSKRDIFWSTRVGGDITMWQTLRCAAEALLDSNIELAQALITASNMLLPNGSLSVAYDERGYEYTIPVYCYIVPSNVTSDKHPEINKSVTENLQDEEVVSVVGKSLPVKVRVYPGDYKIDLIDCLTVNDSVLTLKRRIYDASVSSNLAKIRNDKIAEKETSGSVTIDTTASPGDSAHTSSNNRTLPLCEIGRQRVILLGRELKDNQVLNSLNISDDKVVQIYMRATPTVS